jgi:hypothetical protein
MILSTRAALPDQALQVKTRERSEAPVLLQSDLVKIGFFLLSRNDIDGQTIDFQPFTGIWRAVINKQDDTPPNVPLFSLTRHRDPA